MSLPVTKVRCEVESLKKKDTTNEMQKISMEHRLMADSKPSAEFMTECEIPVINTMSRLKARILTTLKKMKGDGA